MPRCRTIAETAVARPVRQRGVALLAMLVLAGLVGLVLVSTVIGSAPNDVDRDRATQLALARAKEALIAYAVTYMEGHPDDVPGYLPCPHQVTSLREGAAAATCGSAYNGGTTGDNEIGRLPWFTLGIEPLRDGYGECLWYAVSATFKNNPEPAMLNWDSQGRFQIVGPNGTTLLAGATDPDLVVAVVIAPGAPFGGQIRGSGVSATPTCGGNLMSFNYLDNLGAGGTLVDNANPSTNAATGKWRFIQGARSGTFNDRLVYITVRDIWDAIARRADLQTRFNNLTRQVAVCLASYPPSGSSTDRRLPWAVPITDPPVAGYVLTADYDDYANRTFGRTPFDVDKSNDVTGYSNDTLLATIAGGGRCATWTVREAAWWKHWKDHLFYGLSTNYEPDDSPPNSCTTACLRINSGGAYAGVVVFAGRANPSQDRSTNTAKGNVYNYLEGENTDGDRDYVNTGTAPFNDVVYCINTSTSTTPPTAGVVPEVPAVAPIPLPNAGAPKFWIHRC